MRFPSRVAFLSRALGGGRAVPGGHRTTGAARLGPLAVPALALAVTSCAVSPGTISARTSAPAARPIPAGPSASACAASVLALRQGHGSVSASGNSMTYFRVTNKGDQPCTLAGYPTVRVYRQTGGEVPLRLAHGSSFLVVDPGPRVVTLQPDGSVYFAFTWTDSHAASGSNTRCPEGARIKLFIRKGSLKAPSHLDHLCGPHASVTAVAQRTAFTGPNHPGA
jgi:Domain of unknown function (DUF4232)